MYIPYTWRNVFCSPWKVIFPLHIVDNDVVRFVWQLTERRWLYRYNYMRRSLMMFDRFGDVVYAGLFTLYYHDSFPHWATCLAIYITLRLISLALYSNTKLCKCYAVRVVLSAITSSIICSVVAWAPWIIAWNNDATFFFPVCQSLAKFIVYVVILVQAYRKLWILDLDVLSEPKEDYKGYRYHINRRFLLFLDRLFDIFVVVLFFFYHLKSIPHWPVCLSICMILRLISLALCSNTVMWKCYAVRTLLPTILSILYVIVLWIPFILAWINKTLVIVPFCMLLEMSGSYFLLYLAVHSNYY